MRNHNVAFNALWPMTIIESQNSNNHALGGPEIGRKSDILVDGVGRIVQKGASSNKFSERGA